MSDPIPFLTSLGQALATLGLYNEGHPARERALHSSHESLLRLLESEADCRFSFLTGEVVYGNRLLREFREWEWAGRLAGIGVERVEFLPPIAFDDFDRFVSTVYDRLRGDPQSPLLAPSQAPTGIRYGRVAILGDSAGQVTDQPVVTTVPFTLDKELECIGWIHEEVTQTDDLPLVETETVVRSLALAMHQEGQVVLPLLELKRFDQYTTTHSFNVAVLTMGLSEYLGYAPREVRVLGVAALLHDIGKVKVPAEVLLKPGKYTPEERKVIETHPVEGARIIMTRHRNMELAATVAYEHHINLDGSGYPQYVFPREAHFASKLVHVCDIYDALCAKRPYRDAIQPDLALTIVEDMSGRHLDPDLVNAFVTMVRQAKGRRMPVDEAKVEVTAKAI
ncbi:MAG TPA: HD domain-containing phosphohydrolase [Gemmatimonadales bacterium]